MTMSKPNRGGRTTDVTDFTDGTDKAKTKHCSLNRFAFICGIREICGRSSASSASVRGQFLVFQPVPTMSDERIHDDDDSRLKAVLRAV